MKPFDIEKAKAGAPVQTRNGKPARILAYDFKSSSYPVAAAVEAHLGGESLQCYTDKGYYYDSGKEEELDLVMAPVKRTVWVPLYRSRVCTGNVSTGGVYATEELARWAAESNEQFIGAFPITFEE